MTLRTIIMATATAASIAAPILAETVTIENGRGGDVRAHAAHIADLNNKDAQVRVTGKFCASSCTMYMGAKNACTRRSTKWAFHGPVALDPAARREGIKIMAAHYCGPIRGKFLAAWANEFDFHEIPGSTLIAMGCIAGCGL